MSGPQPVMQATARATLWNGAAYALSKGLLFLTSVLLARLLVPADFGLLALGLLAINLLDTLDDFGVGDALVQRQAEADRAGGAALVLNLLTGLGMTVVAFLSAPWVAAFFNEPRALPVVQALAFTFLIKGLGLTHEARLRKNLDFRRRALAEIGRVATKGLVSVGLALAGFGVWSLVWGQLGGGLAATLLYWMVARSRLRPSFDLGLMRSLLGFGSQLVVVELLGMLHKNIDYLIVGRRLDAAQLGYYTIAFRVPELVIIGLCYLLSQALFPTYARLQQDPSALRRGFLSALRYLSLVTVPAGIGLMMVTPEFVDLVYTARWAPAVPVMQALALYAAVYSLSFNAGDVYKAIGRPDILARLGVFKLLLTVPVLWWAAGFSIVHVALGQLAVTVVLTLVRLTVASRVLAVRPLALVQALAPAMASAAGMLLTLLLLGRLLAAAPPVVRLLLLSLGGAAAYGLLLRILFREALAELLGQVRRLWPAWLTPLAETRTV